MHQSVLHHLEAKPEHQIDRNNLSKLSLLRSKPPILWCFSPTRSLVAALLNPWQALSRLRSEDAHARTDERRRHVETDDGGRRPDWDWHWDASDATDRQTDAWEPDGCGGA